MRKIPYGRQLIDNCDIKEVVKVLKSDWITQGPKIKGFEDAIRRYTGAKYAVVVSSGTAALHISCLAAGLKKGDEAITSPITFVASANCILYCQAKPVFADIQEDTVNIDPEEIKKKITKNTKAIIPVHFAGHPCDMQEIHRIARKHKLIVIEDACHALGAEYRGSKIGSCKYSDMTVFSFHPVKSITTGEGGAVLTNRRDFYEKLLILRTHGITKDKAKLVNKNAGGWHYEMQELGFNYRITDFQCALGISQLGRLDEFIKRRRFITSIYNKELSGMREIVLPHEKKYVKSAWHIYPVRLKNAMQRSNVFVKMRAAGISAQVHYIPVHLHPYYRNVFGYKIGCNIKSEGYYSKALSLPLYPGLKASEIKYVVSVLKRSL